MLLPQLAGGSFCVSYWAPEQLDDVIPLLGLDSILLLDNGAFSGWQENLRRQARGAPPIAVDDAYWRGYWEWALPIIDAIPQAVAVIPDVVDGSVEENRWLYTTGLPDEVFGREMQMMPVFHLNEPLSVLEDMIETGYGRIAFGSAGEFAQVGSDRWRVRVQAAFDFIDCLVGDGCQGVFRPRIHMMRGLGQVKFGEFPFDSADSTNIARNHSRLKGGPHDVDRVRVMRDRIEAGAFPSPPSRMWPGGSYHPVPVPGDPPRRRPLQLSIFAAQIDERCICGDNWVNPALV